MARRSRSEGEADQDGLAGQLHAEHVAHPVADLPGQGRRCRPRVAPPGLTRASVCLAEMRAPARSRVALAEAGLADQPRGGHFDLARARPGTAGWAAPPPGRWATAFCSAANWRVVQHRVGEERARRCGCPGRPGRAPCPCPGAAPSTADAHRRRAGPGRRPARPAPGPARRTGPGPDSGSLGRSRNVTAEHDDPPPAAVPLEHAGPVAEPAVRAAPVRPRRR